MNLSQTASMPDNLACPIDGHRLKYCHPHGETARLQCAGGHSFDIARQGYANLLGVQDKRSRDPGDSREMVAARSRILASGLYQPLAQRLAGLAGALSAAQTLASGPLCVLDAGCGEGYYLEQCLAGLRATRTVQGIGLDISKWAVMAAARRPLAGVAWLVGSNRNPPVMAGTVDMIICGFGFPDYAAFSRILRPGGYLLMLDPAENHLVELRRVIYPSLKPYRPTDFSRAFAEGLRLSGRERLTRRVVGVQPPQIQDILVMSPHLYKATAQGKAAAFALPGIDLTLDVNFSVLEKPLAASAC